MRLAVRVDRGEIWVDALGLALVYITLEDQILTIATQFDQPVTVQTQARTGALPCAPTTTSSVLGLLFAAIAC